MSIGTILVILLFMANGLLLVWQERSTDKAIEKYMKLKRQKLVAGLRTYRPSRVENKDQSKSG